MSGVHEHNKKAWDQLVRRRERHTSPASDADLHDPLGTVDARGWLGGDVRGKHVLCLAAGGGKQSIQYTAAGAIVTVVDISPEMLALDRAAAAERGFDIRIVEGSMDDLSALADASFDLVVHPVSTCYVPSIAPVYREVARVTKPGGLYISQHKQPGSLQSTVRPVSGGYLLTEPYYRQGPLPPSEPSLHREPGTLEFLHRWEELIGYLCRAGFVIEDLGEPYHGGDNPHAPLLVDENGAWEHRSRFVAPYVRIKARRIAASSGFATNSTSSPVRTDSPRRTLWLPE